MPTVLRVGRARVVIYPRDHAPPHVHVFADGEVKIDLGGSAGPAFVIWADRAKAPEVRRALAIVERHRQMLLECWKDIHGHH
jgi:hypothetical protein